METSCLDTEKDPLGAMLMDYWKGDPKAYVTVESSLLEMSKMSGKVMFRAREQMSPLEITALELCSGSILDVGAGSGCHSLILQESGQKVCALDISPGCIRVMEKRGVKKRIFSSLFSLENQNFDTLLMLMNGIGICGSIEGLNFFFQFIKPLLRQGGQVIADSTDLASMYGSYSFLPQDGRYYGETDFAMQYGQIKGDPFDWLYIDYATLAYYAGFHGWQCEQLVKEKDGKYLARIY